MQLYRVALGEYAMDLTGEGARIVGGRWNPKGMAVIYTAEHPALAMLEILAHLDRSCAPAGLQLATITIPDDVTIHTPDLQDLPEDWSARPQRASAVQFGQQWLVHANSSLLKLPSVMTPYGEGWNYLLNPSHPELRGRMSVAVSDWSLDGRLFQQ